MPKITLAAPWTYHSIPLTIDYPAGEHEVADVIADAAKAAGVLEEKKNGRSPAKDGSAQAAGDAQG